MVGQLIERTHCLAASSARGFCSRPHACCVHTVLMFFVPFEGMARMVWIAIAFNLYYSVCLPHLQHRQLDPCRRLNAIPRSAGPWPPSPTCWLGVMGAGTMVFPILVLFFLKEDQNLWLLAMGAIASSLSLPSTCSFASRASALRGGKSASQTEGEQKEAPSLARQLSSVTHTSFHVASSSLPICFYHFQRRLQERLNGVLRKWVLDNSHFGTAEAWERRSRWAQHHGRAPHGGGHLFV